MNDLNTTIAQLKHDFFAHRNGNVADALRRAGDQHHTIMGCQLHEVAAIAAQHTGDAVLARALWQQSQHRECQLAATMLYPPQDLTLDEALQWCSQVTTTEVADVLCHRLLRHAPCATSIVDSLLDSGDRLARYTAVRLALNLAIARRIDSRDTIVRWVAKAKEDADGTLLHIISSLEEELD